VGVDAAPRSRRLANEDQRGAARSVERLAVLVEAGRRPDDGDAGHAPVGRDEGVHLVGGEAEALDRGPDLLPLRFDELG
jgi:hypothetical protein